MAMPVPITADAPDAVQAECPWLPDGTLVTSAAITSGTQAGPSFLVRLRRDDLPHAVVDVLLYASQPNPCHPLHLVQVQARWILCDDPGYPAYTERWGTAWTEDVLDPYTGAAAATEAAGLAAVNLARGGDRIGLESYVSPEFASRLFSWDGEPAGWTWDTGVDRVWG